jgi:hypothetical protein
VDREKIEQKFSYHPPSNNEVIHAHEWTRERFMDLAFQVNAFLPDCDEKDDAIKAIDHAAMLVNAAIARTQLKRQALTG